MAFCDYHPCDLCGDNKTFYDADMHYEHDADGTITYGGHHVFALCYQCEQTHKIVIVPKEESDGSS